MKPSRWFFVWMLPGVVAFGGVFMAQRAFATSKGLNQIVTPDVQPEGQFSLSLQVQDRRIANPLQLQAEVGLTSWAEVAVFEGLRPRETIFNAEFALVEHPPWLLSAGFTNWSTRGGGPTPFIEAGYYTKHLKLMAGMAEAGIGGKGFGGGGIGRTQAILGAAYDFDDHWRATFDFQSDKGNSATAGVTYTFNDHFQVNPAVYVTNDRQHYVLGYIVFTYTFSLWSPKKKTPEQLPTNPIPREATR